MPPVAFEHPSRPVLEALGCEGKGVVGGLRGIEKAGALNVVVLTGALLGLPFIVAECSE